MRDRTDRARRLLKKHGYAVDDEAEEGAADREGPQPAGRDEAVEWLGDPLGVGNTRRQKEERRPGAPDQRRSE